MFDVQIPMLFLQGTRDALADLQHLEPLCSQLGRRATLRLLEAADHSFHVLVRSGRTNAEVRREMLDAVETSAPACFPNVDTTLAQDRGGKSGWK